MSTHIDAIAMLASLTGEQLRTKLREIEAERKALQALLRSVAARERAAARRQGREREMEVLHG